MTIKPLLTPADVTAVMTTYQNGDFTRSSTHALRRFYPEMPLIYVDGHPTDPFNPSGTPYTQLLWLPNLSQEYGRNAAATLIKTPLMLLLDNDTKVISPDALTLCLEVMNTYPRCAVTGHYGVIVTNWEKREALVGSDFDGFTEISAFNGIFTLHRMDAWHAVGGQPREIFYPSAPRDLIDGTDEAGWAGDLTICTKYREAGWGVITPQKPLPVIHWGYAVEWMDKSKGKRPCEIWWFSETHHTRCKPLRGVPA